MSHSARTRLPALALAAALLALGCKQQEGDPCDRDEDCAEGLICVCHHINHITGAVTTRGQCLTEDPGTCPSDTPDAGLGPEAGVPEGGVPEAGVDDSGIEEVDAGADGGPTETDAGPPDAGPPDAGPPDAGPADAGSMDGST